MQNSELFTRAETAAGAIQMGDLLAGGFELRGLLEKENLLLRDFEYKAVEEIQPQKEELINAFEKAQKLIAYNRGVLAEYDDEDAEDLRLLAEDLDKAMAENALQLIRAKEVNQMVVGAIADALDRQFNKSRGYNKNGKDTENFKKGQSAVPPMKINESI